MRIWCRPGPATARGHRCHSVISHVIPQQLVQTLNWYRWNCNVFGQSRKVTVGNYVRLLLRWLSPSLLGPSAGRGRRGQAPPDPPAPYTPAARGVLCVAMRVSATQARPRHPRAPRPGQCGYCASSTFARNSPVTISEFELVSLELQRFWAVFKSDRGKLRADFVSPRLCRRARAPQPRATASSHDAHTDRLLLSG